MKGRLRKLVVAAVLSAVSLTAMSSASAEVFYSREGALKLAFPRADLIKRQHLFLTQEQLQRIAELSGAALDAKLLTVYLGYLRGQLLGYAFIDTHTVRTLPETFMVVVSPQGRVERIHILAFHEPREYMPPGGWLRQFRQRGESGTLGSGIAGIAGSTLSANAITAATRKILAIYKVLGLSASPPSKVVSRRETAPAGAR